MERRLDLHFLNLQKTLQSMEWLINVKRLDYSILSFYGLAVFRTQLHLYILDLQASFS